MPEVLTTNTSILCPHGFKGVSQSIDPTWSINGGDVLVEGDGGLLPCTNIVPCVHYTLRSMGLNATQIKGKKVVLVTDFNQTATGLPLTVISEMHRIIDDTTPAPIPDGQDAPPLPPAMTDDAKPIVTVVPPGPLAFTKSTMTPATLGATFRLISAHPLQWMLTVLHEPGPGAGSEDLTSSQPAGLTLTASGGVWNVSPLDITLTMTAAYMETLGTIPPVHRFFMIGVSQRGIWDFVELILMVKPNP